MPSPLNPTESAVDYFKWKAAMTPRGANGGPGINLDIDPLNPSTKPSSIFDYATNQAYDKSYLRTSGTNPIDGINNLAMQNRYQGDLDALLESMITAGGTKNTNIYSSLVWTGFTSTELNDYMKIILKKPSTQNNVSDRRAKKAVNNSADILNSLGSSAHPLIGSYLYAGSAGAIDLPKIGTSAAGWVNSVNDLTTGIIDNLSASKNEFTETQISKIYGNDGVTELYLPMPRQILEQYSHLIDNVELGAVAQMKAGLSMIQGAASLGQAAINTVSTTAGSLTQLAGNPLSTPGFSNIISGIMSSMEFVSASTRKAYNPVQEALYRTPQPRNFQWTFEIMPINQNQSRAVAAIIQALKEHSSPINIGEILYDFPGFVEFEFYVNKKLARFLPRSLVIEKEKRLKVPAFISNIQVDYTGSGMYSHFVDNYPTNYSITIEMVETQPIDRNIILADEQDASAVQLIDTTSAINIRNNQRR